MPRQELLDPLGIKASKVLLGTRELQVRPDEQVPRETQVLGGLLEIRDRQVQQVPRVLWVAEGIQGIQGILEPLDSWDEREGQG